MDAHVAGAERESAEQRRGRSPTRHGGIERLPDAAITHVLVGALVCFFVLSPALFTPWGFGPDYTNHLWLVWQQSLAISHSGHPTLYLQTPGGIFEPFYGFYGGTLYAVAGTVSALAGDHAYPVFIASIGAAAAFAYGGMWWLGRQLGLSRWVAHLPAFVVVTAAYYLADAYGRGAWPEFVALSAVPLFLAGGLRLLTAPWRAGSVALFVVGTVAMTGSHNVTLLWSVLVIGPVAVVAWLVAGPARPSLRRVASVAVLAAVAVGVNAWFLVLDLRHGSDTHVWLENTILVKNFASTFYFDNLGVVLDPLRRTPAQSTTYGLAIAAPVAAFVLGLVLVALSWDQLRRAGRSLRAIWLILLAAMVVLVGLMIMPANWWTALGAPFINIQFPYRLSGWLLVAVAVQLAISLRFARALTGARRQVAIVLGVALIAATVVQATAQMYSGPRLDGNTYEGFRPRQGAFANGPTTPPVTWYAPYDYGDGSLPLFAPPPNRAIILPTPSPGQRRLVVDVGLPPGRAPIATNVAAGPYVVRVGGVRVVGRTDGGELVVRPQPGGRRTAHVVVTAEAGGWQTAAGTISVLCLLAILCLLTVLAWRGGLGSRARILRALISSSRS